MKLLLPTDGKPPATAPGDLLIKLGDRERLDITVLSVNSFATSLEEGARIEHHYSPEAGRSHALAVIDATVEKLRAHGFRAEGKLAEGWPPDKILGEIERSKFTMTLMGSGTASWLGRVLLGSVASKVLHASTSSVLIANDASGDGLPQVLYGTDGSRDARFALHVLMGFAEPGRAAVRVVSVVQPTFELGLPSLIPGDLLESDEQGRRRVAEAEVSRATDLLGAAGFEATGEVLTGHPSEQLLEAADSLGAALVAVGSRGLSAFERTLLGSVSEKVVHHARAALVGRGPPRDLSRDAAWPAVTSAGSQPG